MSRFFVLVEYICQHNNSLLRSIMTSFNEWLEQRDERIYNEMFEKDAPLDLPDTNGQGLTELKWSSGLNCMSIHLNDEGKRYVKSAGNKMFGTGGPSLLKIIDQIGKSIGNRYFDNIDAVTKGTGKISLGNLESDIRYAMGDLHNSQRGNNAFMRSVLNIAYQYGLKVVPNTGGTGMMVMSKEAAERDAAQGKLQADNPSLHTGDQDEKLGRLSSKRAAFAAGRQQLDKVSGRQKLSKPDPFGGTQVKSDPFSGTRITF